MALLAVANISAVLKEFYLEGLRTQINTEADPLWTELEKSTRLVSGEEIVFSLRYGRSGGIGARADDGTLPTANARKAVKARIKTKNLFARMQLTEKTVKASSQDAGAFVNVLEQTLDDLMNDAKDYVQWQVYGDGTGTIAQIDGVSGTTLTLDTTVGLAEGMLIDIMDNTNAVRITAAEITSVDDDNKQIVVSSAAGVLTTDYIVRSGSYNLEMTGLGSIFSQSGSIYGLARSTYPWLKAISLAVNSDISEVKIQEGLDKSSQRSGARHKFLLSSSGVRRGWQVVKSAERSTVNTVELKGGYKAPAYQDNDRLIPWLVGKYAPTQKLRAIPEGHYEVGWMSDWDWMDRDGAVLSRVADKPAYEATLQLYAEIITDLPRGNVEWTSITEY